MKFARWGNPLALATPFSLAIEMALHEEQERRVLEGELSELEDAWREAEEVGAFAASLLIPTAIDAALARLRGVTKPLGFPGT